MPLEPRQVLALPNQYLLVQHSPEATATVNTVTPTKKKEIVITQKGAYHFRFHLYMSGGASTDNALGQVYRNGSAWGAIHTTEADQLNPELMEEDIGGWEDGDLAQLYIWCRTTNRNALCSNFGLWGTYGLVAPTIPPGVVNLSGV